MRLDKFLKVARVIKRRTIASEACQGERVTVNGKQAKPSKEVKEGDVVGVRFGDKTVVFEVLRVPTGNVGKQDADSLYRILEGDRYEV